MREEPLALTEFIKATARELGFDLVGIAQAGPFEETQARLLEHIEQGRIAGLAWFSADRARFFVRPGQFVAGCAFDHFAGGFLPDRTESDRARKEF